MHSGIESPARLEDAKGDLSEFAHHGTDDELGRFAVGGQAVAEGTPPSSTPERHHGGHVQGTTQEGMADLGQTWPGPDAAAGLMQPWAQARKGYELTRPREATHLAQVSQQRGNRALTQAR